MKIKAAVLHEVGGQMQIEYVDLAEPKANEVLVKIVATGVCHTDNLIRQTGMVGIPVVLGHEGAGIIEKVGSDVKGFEEGDHVVLTYVSCETCKYCTTKMPYVCDNYGPLNTSGKMKDGTSRITQNGQEVNVFFGQGSFATYSVVDQSNLIKVDKDVDIAMLGAIGCGFQAGAGTIFGYLDVQPNTSIAIFGLGGVSFSALMAAKIRGCKTIIAVEFNPERLELALELGATHVINWKETEDVVGEIMKITGRGTDYAFDSSGAQSMIDYAIKASGPMGRVALVGGSLGNIEINPMGMMFNNITLGVVNEGAIDPHDFIPQAVQYIKEGKFPIEKLEKFYEFDDLEKAFKDQKEGKTIKPVVRMPI